MRRLIISVLFLSLSPQAFAVDFCKAILDHGIRDTSRTLDLRNKFRVIDNVFCAKSSAAFTDEGSSETGVNIWDIASLDDERSRKIFQSQSEELCSMSYEEFRDSGKFIKTVNKINDGVVNAWGKCVSNGPSRVIHHITTTSDPSLFSYKIIFRPEQGSSAGDVKMTNWNIEHAECEGAEKFKTGFKVTRSGATLNCRRDPTKTVLISVDTEEFSANTPSLELVPYEKRKIVSFLTKLTKHIESGKSFTVILHGNSSESTLCGPDQTQSYLNDLKAGERYDTYYIPAIQGWVSRGPMQRFDGCATHSNLADVNTHGDLFIMKFSAQTRQFKLWGGIAQYSENGLVYMGGSEIGKITELSE